MLSFPQPGEKRCRGNKQKNATKVQRLNYIIYLARQQAQRAFFIRPGRFDETAVRRQTDPRLKSLKRRSPTRVESFR